jgi:streptomycin 6-kinase
LSPRAKLVSVPITIPDGFASLLREETGDDGDRWLAGLPKLAGSMLDRWELTLAGGPMHGFAGLVLPVRRVDGTPAVLKLSFPHVEAEHEALALSTWDGAGAVRLIEHDADAWALLLERLDPDTSLLDVPIDEAIDVIGGLVRRLDTTAPPKLRSMRDNAERWITELTEDNQDVPAHLVDRAIALCRELGPAAGDRLVNEDLHYENVLRGTREPWLLIDPKPIAGDLEFGLIPLLWNRIDEHPDLNARLKQVVEVAGLDLELARGWTFVRAVDQWIECGVDDWVGAACARIAAALAGNR